MWTHGWFLIFFAIVSSTKTINLVKISFTILPMYIWNTFLEVGLLGQRVSAYIILLDIDKFSFAGILSFF